MPGTTAVVCWPGNMGEAMLASEKSLNKRRKKQMPEERQQISKEQRRTRTEQERRKELRKGIDWNEVAALMHVVETAAKLSNPVTSNLASMAMDELREMAEHPIDRPQTTTLPDGRMARLNDKTGEYDPIEPVRQPDAPRLGGGAVKEVYPPNTGPRTVPVTDLKRAAQDQEQPPYVGAPPHNLAEPYLRQPTTAERQAQQPVPPTEPYTPPPADVRREQGAELKDRL